MSPEGSSCRALLELARRLAEPSGGLGDAPLPPSALVREHRLAPLAYRRGAGQFREDFALWTVLAQSRSRVIAECAGALGDVGIEPVLLKGASYASWLYGHPAERPMTDIDILVRPALLRRAEVVLARLGFAAPSPAPNRLHHAVPLQRGRWVIDLHHTVVPPLQRRLDVDEFVDRARPAADRADGSVRLDVADGLLFHLLDLVRNGLVAPLVSYLDAARLVDRAGPATLATARARARHHGFGRGVEAALAMTELCTGATVPNLRRPAASGPVLATAVAELALLPGRRRWRGLARKLALSAGAADAGRLAFAVGAECLARRRARTGGLAGPR